MISTIRLAKNDELYASDSISQISRILGRNRVKREFHGKNFTTFKCRSYDECH